MMTLQSMVSNLTLPYRQGAYIQEIELAQQTDHGLTVIPDYTLDNYAVRFGVEPWDIKPVYLVAPCLDIGDEYVCLSFEVQGLAEGEPRPQVRIPAHTPAGTTYIIPLGEDVNGLTRITKLREWPEPLPDTLPGWQRWLILILVGNIGRLLWTMGWDRDRLEAVAQNVGMQRQLMTAHGYSLDLIGQELRVPRLFPSAYPLDPATIALYHLDDVPDDIFDFTTVDDRVIDATGRHHGTNEGATRGVQGRFDRAFAFRSGDLPRPRCEAEYEFQQKLRSGEWEAGSGEREVRFGPYRRYGYEEGAIAEPGPDGQPHGVWVNDESEDLASRGQLTTACYGFIPEDLGPTIDRFKALGRSVQEAIDYFGDWWGRPDGWFTKTYAQYKIEAPLDRCPIEEAPLTYIRIPNDSAFDIQVDQNFTVEAFIRPVPTQDNRLRIIAIKSREIFYGGPLQAHCVEGWALSMGNFNCISNNVAWSISDMPKVDESEHGRRIVTVLAGLDLGDGQWHHIAGVIDRRYQVARLYVDGVQRGCMDISQMGEIINQEDILLGCNDYFFDAPCDGLIDEVRLSNVARHSFHPALGESDQRYRTRLSIYRPWLIPTYDNINAGLQRLLLTSPFGPEVPAPMLPKVNVTEKNSLRICTERLLTIRPLLLPPGAHIDLEGDRQQSEEVACGPSDEHFFDWQLVNHNNSAVYYYTDNAHLMQLATARSLDKLVGFLQHWMTKTGKKLQVLAAYEPGGDARQSVGRAQLLHMEDMPASVLAAFAHKACFDYVEHQAYAVVHDGVMKEVVRAAVREELDKLEIATKEEVDRQQSPGRNSTVQIKVGDQVQLTVSRPDVPDKRYFKWLLIECGAGHGELQAVEGDNASRVFVAKMPGRLIVKVEFWWQGVIVIGRRDIEIELASLSSCESIGSDGNLGVSEEEAAGRPEGFFHEALLLKHDNAQVDYGSNANNHQMQLGMEKALNRLLAQIALVTGISGQLRILKGYDPAASDLFKVGQKLMLAHEDQANMPLGRLAALAHEAGFAWVYHPPYPDGIFVATGPESPLEITSGLIELLPPNAVINWLGIMRPNVPEAPIMPGTTFDPTDTANKHDDPARVTYADDNSHLMTQALQKQFNALLDRLKQEGATGKVQVLGAFDDKANNRRRIGKALQIRHDSVPLERLGALAYQVGLDYVKHVTIPSDPAERYIYASVWRNDSEDFSNLIDTDIAEIVDYSLLDPIDQNEIAEGGIRRICLRPDVLGWQPPGTQVEGNPPPYQAAFPEAAHYYWCITRYGAGQGLLDSPPERVCKLVTAQQAGVLGVRGEFVLGDGTEPYSFALLMEANAQGKILPVPKLVYDDLMNFLEFHHPVGVEGHTLELRKHVPDLIADPLLENADTERTYPHYRQRNGAVDPIEVFSTTISEISCPCPPWQGNNQREVNEHG
jgi:hypothetical protein